MLRKLNLAVRPQNDVDSNEPRLDATHALGAGPHSPARASRQ